jgi:tyrosyl-tRNA synthetase
LNEKTGFEIKRRSRALTANSISVNKEKSEEDFVPAKDLINNQFVLLQSGKKNILL